MAEPTQNAPSRRRRRFTIAAACGVAVALVAVLSYVFTRPDGHRAAAAPKPTVTTSTAPTPSATPSSTVPREPVAAARPTSFTFTGPRFTIKGHVCPMANIRPYDPPGEQHHTICWVRSGFGVAPSSTQPATSYLFGHAWAQDSQEVLNKASSLATEEILSGHPHMAYGVPVYPVHSADGYRLVLRTKTGTLTYVVRSAWAVRKNQLGFIKSWLNPKVPGRVVLTTCAERGGRDYDYNVIWEAYLYSSVSA